MQWIILYYFTQLKGAIVSRLITLIYLVQRYNLICSRRLQTNIIIALFSDIQLRGYI